MALSLSSAAIVEKNALSSSGAWLVLMKIVFPDTTTIRVVRNNENITWPTTGGNTWIAFPFELDDAREDGSGEHSVLTVRVGNVSRAIQAYMEADGAKGGVGSAVDIHVVHSDHLDLTSAEVNESFICTSAHANSEWASFDLSAPNQVYVIYPPRRLLKNFCAWSFQDAKCGYSGTTLAEGCIKTIDKCRFYGNVRFFGGYPGIPEGGIYVQVDK